MAKEALKTIGKVGSCDVVDYEGTPCLKLPAGDNRHTIIGPSKIKTVLANADVCRQFLAQYDKPKNAPVAPASAETSGITAALAKQLADLQAQLLALKAPASSSTPTGRFQPEQANAVAA